MPTPSIAHAQVVSVDSNEWSMNVVFQSVQMPGIPVRPVSHGYADTLRVRQDPLPSPGTWGIVVFPYGDTRNGRWLGATYTQGNDALVVGDPDRRYEAHASGAWETLDGQGNYTKVNADGSSLVIGNSGTVPAVTRNVVNEQQVRAPITYPQDTRRKSAASPLPWVISVADGGTFTIKANSTTITVDASGNITFDLASGAQFNVTQGGSASDSLVLVSAFIAAFNAHTHDHGPVPDRQLVPADVKSVLVEVQE